MNHLEIDFHVYSDDFSIEKSFRSIARISRNPKVKEVLYKNLRVKWEGDLRGEKAMGTEVYEAAIADGVKTFDGFCDWKKPGRKSAYRCGNPAKTQNKKAARISRRLRRFILILS